VVRQRGEVGIALRVDLLVAVHQGDGRELVEDDQDDGRRRADVPALDMWVLDKDELRRVRAEEEQREENERRGSQDGQERADGRRLTVEQRAESSGRRRDDE